jgi:hypothetical protein
MGFDAGAPGFTGTDSGISLTGIVTHTTTCTGLNITPTTETLTVTQIPLTGSIVYTGTGVVQPPTQPQSTGPTYAAAFTPAACYTGTPPTVWTVDNPSISTISATGVLQLVYPLATTFHVTGYSGGWTNSASPSVVNVIVNAIDVSNAPTGYTTNPPTEFTTPTPTVADNITVLYPYTGTVLPLGLPAPVIQWSNGGTAANAVRVQLRYPAGTGALFTWSGILAESQTQPTPTLTGQPRAFVPQNVWTAFEQTSQGNAADIVIQRIVGGVLRKPNTPINITFASGQLKGTVYYQSYGTNLATNYCCTYNGASFGGATLGIQPGATAPVLVAGNNGTCVVCHTVASGGSKLLTQNGANYAQTLQYNLSTLASTTLSPSDGRFAWGALSSDGSYLFSNSGPQAMIESTATTGIPSSLYSVPAGTAIAATGLPTFSAVTPTFSPNNAHVAFNFYGGTTGGHTGDQASLGSIDYSQAGAAFSNFQVLATPGSGGVGSSGNNIYYPSYLPSDTQLVWELQTVYNTRDVAGTRSQCDQAGPVACQNDGTHAELWWTDVASKTSSKLFNLNGGISAGGTYLPSHAAALIPAGDDQLNYEPTVNPQITGGYAWVVFTSRRMYGNIATINPFWSDPRYENISAQPTPKKLWVAAINPNAAPGTDPSYPAFYLPGQELLAGNSRGYWVLNQCEAAGPATTANLCTSALDCCASTPPAAPVVCALDAPPATTAHCSSSSTTTCAANGAACSTSSQCCGFPNSVCAQNVCTPSQTVTYNPSSFTVDYVGASCPPGDLVSWVDVGLEAMTPASGGTNSTIVIGAQTSGVVGGTTATTYAPTTPVSVGTLTGPPANQSTTWNNFPLSTALSTISTSASNQPFLQITFTLNPTTDHLATPTLVDWRVRFDCTPVQ